MIDNKDTCLSKITSKERNLQWTNKSSVKQCSITKENFSFPLFFLTLQTFLKTSYKQRSKTDLKRRWKLFITFFDNYNKDISDFLNYISPKSFQKYMRCFLRHKYKRSNIFKISKSILQLIIKYTWILKKLYS